jgi:hypothetical protein
MKRVVVRFDKETYLEIDNERHALRTTWQEIGETLFSQWLKGRLVQKNHDSTSRELGTVPANDQLKLCSGSRDMDYAKPTDEFSELLASTERVLRSNHPLSSLLAMDILAFDLLIKERSLAQDTRLDASKVKRNAEDFIRRTKLFIEGRREKPDGPDGDM